MACGLIVAAFAWNISLFYFDGLGFTHLVVFGSKEHARYLPEVQVSNHFEEMDSMGYDSQWYAQIAVRPRLTDPALRNSVDSLPYRARRILFEWTAWVLGGGDPQRVLYVYAAQNVACWFLLALLLFRWLPPDSWGNVLRWGATLFSFGLIFSVRRALPDGPSLLLLAGSVALIETGRPWAGALLAGVTGLGKDTSVMGAAFLGLPSRRRPGSWRAWMGQVALVLAPLAAWVVYLRVLLGTGDDIGARNFSAPFCALSQKLLDAVAAYGAERPFHKSIALLDLLVQVGLLAQFAFFAFRIRWRDPWWRLGASFAVLMAVLGVAVWEGFPSAAARVLLPMTFAFNVSLPRGRGWALLLVAGNLGVFSSFELLNPPGKDSFHLDGPRELRINLETGKRVEVLYTGRNWFLPERSRLEYWRWAMGDGTVAVVNPHPAPVVADISFGLSSPDQRDGIVSIQGMQVWRGPIQPGQTWPVMLRDVVLAPGETDLLFQSDLPPRYPGGSDRRKLMYSVRNLEVELKARR